MKTYIKKMHFLIYFTLKMKLHNLQRVILYILTFTTKRKMSYIKVLANKVTTKMYYKAERNLAAHPVLRVNKTNQHDCFILRDLRQIVLYPIFVILFSDVCYRLSTSRSPYCHHAYFYRQVAPNYYVLRCYDSTQRCCSFLK